MYFMKYFILTFKTEKISLLYINKLKLNMFLSNVVLNMASITRKKSHQMVIDYPL
jgi:hypothetical protein